MLSHLDVDNDIDNHRIVPTESDDIGKERRGETTSNTISHFRKDHTPTGTLRRRPRRAWAKPAGQTNQDQGRLSKTWAQRIRINGKYTTGG